ncbi:MAG: hypothetical protein JRN16_01460 [Nitrososphaerota archaeon]|jgi:hypothetical protein|nr:hypothetical protein [Nitrososphaerota archaeon]MDG6919788.1 hypothetical protein [Nitrososphaerota archaeon]MDG6969441.1 hypothetical protein [Nitrososphaerota archaeon]MDG6973050.1 hypothetical protein [Nitrososphaerota archaeon]MDG6976950.1 hypothetical protein [Nitrososphaerota archaeon]
MVAKKRNWREYNEELVRRGELLFDPAFYLDGGEGSRARTRERRGRGIAIQAA